MYDYGAGVNPSISDLERRIAELQGFSMQQPTRTVSIWDMIDAEIQPLTEAQKAKLAEHPDYIKHQTRIMSVLNAEFIQLMKPYVEKNRDGYAALQEQLKFIRDNKTQVITETNAELELLKRFQESAKTNPSITWEEFVKSITK